MDNDKYFILRGRILLVLLALSCTGCSDLSKRDLSQEENPYVLFEKGVVYMQKEDFSEAATCFEKVQHEHPASELAPLSQIRYAYVLYKQSKYQESLSEIEDFSHQNPVHPNTDYILYLRSLCYYNQLLDSQRDQEITSDAIESFDELLTRFPQSRYTQDSLGKRRFAINSIVGKDMAIAAYYRVQANSIVAAIPRYQTVIQQYQESIFTPEALYRLVEAYYSMGAIDEARKYAAVLGHNYSNSYWYHLAHALVHTPALADEAKKEGQ